MALIDSYMFHINTRILALIYDLFHKTYVFKILFFYQPILECKQRAERCVFGQEPLRRISYVDCLDVSMTLKADSWTNFYSCLVADQTTKQPYIIAGMSMYAVIKLNKVQWC